MIFWLALIVAGFFAWLGTRLGFYGTWILLCNLVLACYMGIFLTPMLVGVIPQAASAPDGYAMTLIGTFAATLLFAYGISFGVLRGRLVSPFSWALDTFGGGLMGFLAGFMVWGFWTFSLCLTPYSQTDSCKRLGLGVESQRATLSYVCGWCGLLHFIVSSSDGPLTARQAVTELIELGGAPVVGAYSRKPAADSEDEASPEGARESAPEVPVMPAGQGEVDAPASTLQPGR